MKKLLTYIFLNVWINLNFAKEFDLDYEWQQALNLAQTLQDQKASDETDDEQQDEGKVLDYAGLMRIMKGLHDEIMDIKTMQKNEILDRVYEIQQENEELIIEMTNQFTERTTEIYNNGMTIIATLGKYMMQNQMELFTFAEILIQKIKDEKAQQIQQAQNKINQLLLKFPPPRTACDLINDCETCINHANCIWCSQNQMCHEGNQLDGAFFFPCPYQIFGTCDTPKSQQFFELEMIPYKPTLLENYLMDQNMPFEQKQYIMKKQNEMIMFKNEINQVRLKLNSIQNLTIILRAKRIILQFYMNELEKNPNLDIQNDDDYIEFFLDIIDIDDVGDVVTQLEDEVELQKMEDEIKDEQAMEEQLELEREKLEARRAVYENSESRQQVSNVRQNNKPQQKHQMGNGDNSGVKAGQDVQQQQSQQKDNSSAETVEIDDVPQDATLDELLSHQKQKDKQKQKNYLYYYQN